MDLGDLKGKRVTVMGLGLHGGGRAVVRFLSEAQARVTVTDLKSKEELEFSLEQMSDLKDVKFVLGQHRSEDFAKADMVIKNPAVPWSNKYIQLAIENKIPVEMDSSLFFKLCRASIVGVTGTKGKTTTASLIYNILKLGGKNVIKVGIGQTSVLDKVKDLKKDTLVVFELSSWRLSALGKYKFSPKIAVVTNIYPDHLNYYKSMDEYIQDKKNIFTNQGKNGVCIVNSDNLAIRNFEKEIKSRLIRFSKNKLTEGEAVYSDNGTIYYNNGIDEKKIIDIKDIKIKGEHNLENVMAAAGASLTLGIGADIIKKAIISFSGVAHRLELVRELSGVKYVNDTAATTPEAAISALNSYMEPIILICGGSDKNLEMNEFGKVILGKTKAVIFLKGKATDKIISSLEKNNETLISKEYKIAQSMEEAVEMAKTEAQKGDVVLLSPGAASFGMFINEFDRGINSEKQ